MPQSSSSTMSSIWDTGYKIFMKRNSVYLVFVFGGAIIGERVVNGLFNKAWEENNKGKLFVHMVDHLKEVQEAGGGEEE